MKGKKSLLIFVAFFSILAISGFAKADTYYVYNYWGGTWHDANKTWDGDNNLCWAAAASNILDWAGWGAQTYTTQTAIFQYFTDHWTDAGSLPRYAWDWWLNGTLPPDWKDWSKVEVSGGNFWPLVPFSSVYGEGSGDLLAAVDSFFDSGYGVTLAIYTSTGGGHGLTCWGYDYTDLGGTIQYNGIYVTDSDDKAEALRYYGLILSGGVYYLDDYFSSDNWYIGEVQALGQNPVPLPPALLLFGSGLLALGAWRRLRRD
jgi:hypothetical protein